MLQLIIKPLCRAYQQLTQKKFKNIRHVSRSSDFLDKAIKLTTEYANLINTYIINLFINNLKNKYLYVYRESSSLQNPLKINVIKN